MPMTGGGIQYVTLAETEVGQLRIWKCFESLERLWLFMAAHLWLEKVLGLSLKGQLLSL